MAVKKIHILGICGTFMGGLALLARELGFEVSGCDENVYPPMSDLLKEQNIKVIKGYNKKDLPEADLYLIGNVISRGNESIEYILDSKLPHTSGPSWLAENILKNRRVIAVSGTHGKTSTTAMLTWVLLNLGMDPGFLIAGRPKDFSVSAKLGKDEIFVIEADEYDTCYFDKKPKFFHYNPDILLINNIEFDHADIYENIEMIEKNFLELIASMSKESKVLVNSNKVRQSFKKSVSNLNATAKIEFFELSSLDIEEENKQLACKALQEILTTEQVLGSLEDYGGVKRRFETIYENSDFKVIDDFAHHPTAIEETLAMAIKENLNVELIVELGSNSMRVGIHDNRLIKIFSTNNAYTINASKEQQNKFTGIAKELNLEDLETICSKNKEKKTILMCGNRNFQGFQQLIIDKLIK